MKKWLSNIALGICSISSMIGIATEIPAKQYDVLQSLNQPACVETIDYNQLKSVNTDNNDKMERLKSAKELHDLSQNLSEESGKMLEESKKEHNEGSYLKPVAAGSGPDPFGDIKIGKGAWIHMGEDMKPIVYIDSSELERPILDNTGVEEFSISDSGEHQSDAIDANDLKQIDFESDTATCDQSLDDCSSSPSSDKNTESKDLDPSDQEEVEKDTSVEESDVSSSDEPSDESSDTDVESDEIEYPESEEVDESSSNDSSDSSVEGETTASSDTESDMEDSWTNNQNEDLSEKDTGAETEKPTEDQSIPSDNNDVVEPSENGSEANTDSTSDSSCSSDSTTSSSDSSDDDSSDE